MFSLEVSYRFQQASSTSVSNKLNCPMLKATGIALKIFHDLNFWDEACVCVRVFKLCVAMNQNPTFPPVSLVYHRVKASTLQYLHVTHPTSILLYSIMSELQSEEKKKELRFNLHTRTRPNNNSHSNSGANSRALLHRKPTFCLKITGNRGLRRRRGV